MAHDQSSGMNDTVDLYWIPLGAGAGGGLVRWSGRLYERAAATAGGRPRCDLFHSALEVRVGDVTTTIEMAPVWTKRGERGVVAEGAVGARFLGRSRWFRYEVRRWSGGSIPDAASAVDSPVRVAHERADARAVLDLVTDVPTCTWGRDELGAGEMWNSNSIVSWLLVTAGISIDGLHPPLRGRAPGWNAGRVVALRSVDPSRPG